MGVCRQRMACLLVESPGLREQKFRLALTWRNHEDRRAWLGESLVYGQHSTYRALACLTAAT